MGSLLTVHPQVVEGTLGDEIRSAAGSPLSGRNRPHPRCRGALAGWVLARVVPIAEGSGGGDLTERRRIVKRFRPLKPDARDQARAARRRSGSNWEWLGTLLGGAQGEVRVVRRDERGPTFAVDAHTYGCGRGPRRQLDTGINQIGKRPTFRVGWSLRWCRTSSRSGGVGGRHAGRRIEGAGVDRSSDRYRCR